MNAMMHCQTQAAASRGRAYRMKGSMKTLPFLPLLVPALLTRCLAFAGRDVVDMQPVQHAVDAKIKAKKELANAQSEAA